MALISLAIDSPRTLERGMEILEEFAERSFSCTPVIINSGDEGFLTIHNNTYKKQNDREYHRSCKIQVQNCLQCGTYLGQPPGEPVPTYRPKKYCTSKCRHKAWRERKKNAD